jgi:hypothetical protein
MKYILTNISPNNKVGLGNQIYSLAHSLSWAIKNKINIVFYKQFLNEINTNSYSNISDIIDIELTNYILEKYNIQIADYNKFDFKLVSMKYQLNNSYIDISDKMNEFMINGVFHIKSYYVFLDSNTSKLLLTYTLNNKTNTLGYDIINGHLQNDIIINFTNIQLYTFTVFCDTEIFYDVRTNIIFNNTFRNNTLSFIINNYINTKQNINCIHLRLEDDAINSWSEQNNLNKSEFKTIIEQKYISKIKEKIQKNDLTIILSSDYNNNVIKFLKENKYNYITTPKLSQYRDIAAIYDYHIAELCNNIFIGVFESSYTYIILYRIKNHIRQFLQIYYTSDTK